MAKKAPVCIPMGEAGYSFKGVKGIKPKQVFIDAANFAGQFKEDEIHQIGRQYIEGYDSDNITGDGSELVWEWLMNLEVGGEKATAKAPVKPKTRKQFDFNLEDPTVWAKAPNQVRVFLDNINAAGVAHMNEDEMSAFAKKLVEDGKLVTRQDPFNNVFMYYVKDKKRGFHADSTADWAHCVDASDEPQPVAT